MIGTITTKAGADSSSMKLVAFPNKALDKTIKENCDKLEDGSFIDAYNKSVNNENSGCITTRVSSSNETFIAIKTANSKGYELAENGDGVDVSSRMESHRGTVQKGVAHTIDTKNSAGGVIVDERK